MNKLEQYWITLEDPDELAQEIHNRIDEFYSELDTLGITNILNRCYAAYYGGDLSRNGNQLFESAALQEDGDAGQLTKYKVNHYKNLITHLIALVSTKKTKFGARAANTDAKSQHQTILAKGVVEYYWRDKDIQNLLRQALELSLVQLEAWVHQPWEPELGSKRPTADGSEAYEGDIVHTLHPLHDVIRDLSIAESPWKILRSKINKWDVLAKRPELIEVLDKLEAKDSSMRHRLRYGLGSSGRRENPDLVDHFILYHEKTPAVPTGRLIEMVGSHILHILDLPYRKVPLHRLSTASIMGTGLSYSVGVDMLGPQQAHDLLNSTIISNQAAHGVGIVWTQTGDSLSHSELTTGLVAVQSNTKPEGVNLTNTPPEIFKQKEATLVDMQTISGINGTVRGEPPPQATSGTSQALLVSQAVQFASPLEMAADQLAENLATGIIHLTQDFSQTSKVATIVGESKKPYLTSYSADDISNVDRIIVEKVNPLSQHIAGRVQMADTMMQHGTISAEQYLQIVETGSLDAVTEGKNNQSINIKAENEELRRGGVVPVLIIDDHQSHIESHKELIASPEDRNNPEIVNSVLSHIQQHMDQWRNMPPDLMAVLKLQPLPAPPPAAGPNLAPPGNSPDPQQPNMPNLPDGTPEPSQEAYSAMQGQQP